MLEELLNWMANDNAKMPYIVTGEVIMNYNPLLPASVLVKIPDRDPLMSITTWARVAMPLAGSTHYNYALPGVGDEVVVAFCNGEINNPVVIGSLFSPFTRPPMETLNPLNTFHGMKTSAGHNLTMDDLQGIKLTSVTKMGLEMNDLTLSTTLHDTGSKVSVKLDGIKSALELKGLTSVTLSSGMAKITLDGITQSITIKAPSITLDALQALTLKGTQVNIKGQLTNVEGTGQLTVKSAAITNVKGAMVKIN